MALSSAWTSLSGVFARTSALVLIFASYVATASGANLPSGMADAQRHLERALALGEQYRWADAASDFRSAESGFLSDGDQRNLLYARLGLLRATIEQHNLPQASRKLLSQLETNQLLKDDQQLRLFCLIVKGDIDLETDVRSAKLDWEQVQALAARLGNERWKNRALAQIGIAAFFDRDLETARKNVATAVAVANNLNDYAAEIRFTTVLGRALTEERMYDQAVEYFAKALALAKLHPETGYPFLTYAAQIEAFVGLKRLDEAQVLVDALIKESNLKHRTGPQADILPTAAKIAISRGNVQLGIQDLQQSIQICKAEGYAQIEATDHAMLSTIYEQNGDLIRAERSAAEAARLSQVSSDKWALPERLQLLARIQARRGEYLESDRTYQKASDFVDTGLLNSGSALEKTALISASGTLFPEHFALVATKLRDVGRAYSLLERVRGRVLADLLMSGAASSPGARDVERRIAVLELRMMASKTTSERARLRDEIFNTQELRWISPGVSIFKHKALQVVPLENVARSLDASTAILEYVLAEPQSYCLVITNGSQRVIPLVGQSRIDSLITAYLQAVEHRLPADTEARQLYDVLLGPVPESRAKAKLIIVPDGQVHRLPVEALEEVSGAYVLNSHVVAYAPSSTALYLLSRESLRDKDSVRPLLAIGDIPYARPRVQPVSLLSGDAGSGGIADLIYSKQEVLDASASLGGSDNKLILGSAATESAFKSAVQRHYGTIHIAAHAVASDSNPDNSAIVMLPDASASEDGLLHATEIAMMRLNTTLVVLSACDTGVGPVRGEEGISTLANSFLLAGTRSVVSTLWSDDDRSSLVLMKEFYRE